MCGIAGVIARRKNDAYSAIPAMTVVQVHRGPDDSGEMYERTGAWTLGLGHRRLSIIDLSRAGHQPMVDALTGNQIVFNGEIYNSRVLRRELESAGVHFAGHSDTEVLLYALGKWGPACLKRLNGMFAFAFYDAREQSVLLARDSVGIKPLYVAHTKDAVIFASEVRAVLQSGLVDLALDMQGMAGLLAYGCLQQPLTLFKAIRSFPPGSYQVFPRDGGASAPVAYWEYPDHRVKLSEADATAAVATTLELAVRDHLVSDVPVGVFLSSGLDSTIVAALAAKHTPHIRSFSVGFADQPDMSELTLAAETATLFGLEHTDILINGADAEVAAMKWLGALDQPSVDGLNVYIISQAVRARSITVALSGQGGDELFGGYPSFEDVPRLHRALRKMDFLPGGVRSALASAAALGKSKVVRQKLSDMARSGSDVLDLYLHRRRAMSRAQMRELGLSPQHIGLSDNYEPPEALAGIVVDDGDIVRAVSQLESRFYQHNMLLRDGDANGMAHSLEIRVPMLDQRMLDLMLPVTGDVRLPTRRANKHLLRMAFAPYLRPALLNQKKKGFVLPIKRWMMGPMRELCEQSLGALKDLRALRHEGIDGVWRAFLRQPESPIWTRAFTLVVLGHYVRKMRIRG